MIISVTVVIVINIITLNSNQLRQTRRPRNTLTKSVKQPYHAYCLWYVDWTIGAQWTTQRWCQETLVIPSVLPTHFSVGVWAGPKQSQIHRNFPHLYLLKGIVTLLKRFPPQSQPMKASWLPVEYSMQKHKQLVVCSCFILWTQ